MFESQVFTLEVSINSYRFVEIKVIQDGKEVLSAHTSCEDALVPIEYNEIEKNFVGHSALSERLRIVELLSLVFKSLTEKARSEINFRLGKLMKSFREGLGMTRLDFAIKCGTTGPRMMTIEQGKINLSLVECLKLIDVFEREETR